MIKKQSVFLINAVVVVHCVKSDIFQEGTRTERENLRERFGKHHENDVPGVNLFAGIKNDKTFLCRQNKSLLNKRLDVNAIIVSSPTLFHHR